MKSLGPLDFGQAIAFLLPGFVAIYALGYVSPRIAALIERSYSKDGGIGAEIALVLFSLAAGMIVSSLRDLTLDWLQKKIWCIEPDFSYSSLKDKEVRETFEATVANTYRFSQFYGNMFVGLLLLAILRVITSTNVWDNLSVTVILIISLIVLFIVHGKQLKETYDTLSEIFS